MNAMSGAYIGCNKNFQDESGVHAAPRIASFSFEMLTFQTTLEMQTHVK